MKENRKGGEGKRKGKGKNEDNGRVKKIKIVDSTIRKRGTEDKEV